jgi:hypothetical protein
MYLGFEKPGITGGDASSLALPLLLGGVLKGETSAASEDASGASDARAVVSIGSGLFGIFGLPARLMGGGICGTEEVGRSFLRGSTAGAAPVLDGNRGFESSPGVLPRLGILKEFAPFVPETGVVGESSAAWDFGRDCRGECIGDPKVFGGDLGD